MSYEAWGEPDDSYMTPEQAGELGWLEPETAIAVRRRVQELEFLPEPGNRLHAQLIMLQVEIGVLDQNDPHAKWARALLGELTVEEHLRKW